MVWPAHAALLWTASSVQRALVHGGVVVVVVRPGRGAVDAVVVEEAVAGVVVVVGVVPTAMVISTVSGWPACAIPGQLSMAWAARPSAGRPPSAIPSVRSIPRVVNRERMSRLLLRWPRCYRTGRKWRGPFISTETGRTGRRSWDE